MTRGNKMTTKKETTEPTKSTGEKAYAAIDSFVRMVLSHQGSSNNMKGHTAWMPASLYPNGKGGYAVLNIKGFLIGEKNDVKITKDWVVDENDLNLDGLTADENGEINLFSSGYPWESEGLKTEFIGKLVNVFKVPGKVIRAGRPVAKNPFHFGQS